MIDLRNQRLGIRPLSVLVGMMLIGSIFAFLAQNETPEPVETASITVAEIINRVEVKPVSDMFTKWDGSATAKVGLQLTPGDGIRTYSESEARVDIAIGDTVRFVRTTPNTIWRLGDFVASEGAVIDLERGRILVFDEQTPEGRPPLKVITRAGTATAHGTWMSVQVDEETGEAFVQCFRGSCELANEFGSQLLSDQQKGSFTEKTAPTLPTFMTFEEEEVFLDIPEAEDGRVAVPEIPKPDGRQVFKRPAYGDVIRIGAVPALESQDTSTVSPIRETLAKAGLTGSRVTSELSSTEDDNPENGYSPSGVIKSINIPFVEDDGGSDSSRSNRRDRSSRSSRSDVEGNNISVVSKSQLDGLRDRGSASPGSGSRGRNGDLPALASSGSDSKSRGRSDDLPALASSESRSGSNGKSDNSSALASSGSGSESNGKSDNSSARASDSGSESNGKSDNSSASDSLEPGPGFNGGDKSNRGLNTWRGPLQF